METERLFLRPFLQEDLLDFADFCRLPGLLEKTGRPHHKTLAESALLLSQWQEDESRLALVLKENRRVVGYLALKEDSEEGRSDTRELGFALSPAFRRRGLMKEAVGEGLCRLFSEKTRYVWACCFVENLPSKMLIESCGFQFQNTGTFYSPLLDEVFASLEYRLSKEEWEEVRKAQKTSEF